MEYKTHCEFGLVFGAGAVIVAQNVGVIPSDITGDFAALAKTVAMSGIIIWTAKLGSSYPDLDHPKAYVTNKNIIGKLLHICIRLTGPKFSKHRSRFTHSYDATLVTFGIIALVLKGLLAGAIYAGDGYSIESRFFELLNSVLPIFMLALITGVWSHVFADSLTTEGSYLSMFCKNRFSFVPGNLEIMGAKPLESTFKTNSPWEHLMYLLSKGVFYVFLGIIVIQTFRSIFIDLLL